MKKLILLLSLITISYLSFAQRISRVKKNLTCGFYTSQETFSKVLLQKSKSANETKQNLIGPPEPENVLAAGLTSLGDTYFTNNLNEKALENYLQAFKELKNAPNEYQNGQIAYKLGLVYVTLNQIDNAVKTFNTAANSFEAINFKENAAKCYIELAMVERIGKNFKSAEYLIMKKGLPMCNPVDNIRCYDVLAHTYQDLSRYSEAKWFYLQVNTLARWRNDTVSIITSLTNLGRVKTSIKDYKLAVKDFKEAQMLAKNAKLKKYLPEINAALLSTQNIASGKKVLSKMVAEVNNDAITSTTLASAESVTDNSLSVKPQALK